MNAQQCTASTETVTQVTFGLTDPDRPYVGLSADGGRVRLQAFVPRGGGYFGEFFSVSGVDPETVRAAAEAHPSAEASVVCELEAGYLVEFVVGEDCPAVFLGARGALPRTAEAIDGEGRLTADVPPDVDATEVTGAFLDAHPDASLVAKREQPYDRPLVGLPCLGDALDQVLTDRQREALETAMDRGYYEWPRETTGEDVARALGISPPTFHEHLRAAERRLVELAVQVDRPFASGGSDPVCSANQSPM